MLTAVYRKPNGVSTHSRAKAAAAILRSLVKNDIVSTHSRAKAAAPTITRQAVAKWFQHTAARRRLLITKYKKG